MLDVGGNIVHHDACKLWALEGCFQVEIADVDTHEFCIKCQDSALEVESGGGEGCSSCCCFTQVINFPPSIVSLTHSYTFLFAQMFTAIVMYAKILPGGMLGG